jgi:VanZ family protein
VLAIFVVGSLPGAPPVARELSDKAQHAIGFGLLAWLWCRALHRLLPSSSLGGVALGGFGVSVGVGGLLELWQALLSYRTCEFLDWIADAMGAALAAGTYVGLRYLRGPRPRAAG